MRPHAEAPGPHESLDGPTLARGSRLCFVADGRSPIARNWIRHFVERGDEVHLVSTFPCEADQLGVASVHLVPVAFGALAGGSDRTRSDDAARRRSRLSTHRSRLLTAAFPVAFGWLAPLEMRRHVARTRAIVRAIDPALVHAMRIPYEGMLAAAAVADLPVPLVVSIWGNDLELWATRYPLLGRLTRRTLRRATALHPDCARDLALAVEWGWDMRRLSAVLPGNGGVRAEVFHARGGRADVDGATAHRFGLTAGAPLVLNARGVRGYVRNDTFFHAVPLVLAKRPDARFAGVGMEGNADATRWVTSLGIGRAVRLLPRVTPEDMARLFRAACVAVSPATHDGTPNTLLEAMACGAFPVAGDIASVREWIVDGDNGLLFDPTDADALAAALLRALDDEELRASAGARNATLVAERAEFARCMRRAERLYGESIDAARPRAVR